MKVFQIIARHPTIDPERDGDDQDGVYWVSAKSKKEVARLLVGRPTWPLWETGYDDADCPGLDATLPQDLEAVKDWIRNPQYQDGTCEADYKAGLAETGKP